MTLSIADLHEIVGGQLRLGEMPPRDGEFTAIGRIVTDSRAISVGNVFWGLPGTEHDGSHFAEEALARGACGVVTSGRWVAPWAGRWSLEVANSAAAIWRLAAWNCDRFSGRLVTIEGALGKSSAAAMTAAVLNARFMGETIGGHSGSRAAKETAVALAHLPVHHDYAIVELHSGLASQGPDRLTKADVGVFVHSGSSNAVPALSTAVDTAVIERLRSAVRNGSRVIVNGDDAALRRVSQGAANVVFIGRGTGAHILADRIESANGQLRFSVAGRRYCVATWGRHQLTTALAAIAVGRHCGLSDAEIAEGLSSFEPLNHCCQILHAGGVTIIDDTGRSGPAATIAAMDLLSESGAHGRRIMLYGDEPESDEDPELPRALGEHAVTRAAADLLIASGRSAGKIVEAANHGGLRRTSSIVCETPDEAEREVLSRLRPGDAVLVSGRPMAAVKQKIQQHQIGTLRRAA
ncbi:MAG: Mur ligase domain-containing protein [Pirellulales bacterium]